MDPGQIQEHITAGEFDAVETAWLEAVEEGASPAELAGVLEALVEAGQMDLAETLGWACLAERAQGQGAGSDDRALTTALETAREFVSAVPVSDELRAQAAELYRARHGEKEHFETLLEAAGLLSGQSPRRAFRTLETCLSIGPGSFLAHRFEGDIVRVEAYDPAAGEYRIASGQRGEIALDPKHLADEFDPVDPQDFRVLREHRREEFARLLAEDPAGVLVGLCRSRGGRIDSTAIKDALVPEHVDASSWTSWWNRARTAAKRSETLTIEGRNPIVVAYHPGGRTLEEELASDASEARTPAEILDVLRRYVREAAQRKVEVDSDFAGPLLERLVKRAKRGAAKPKAGGLDEAFFAALGVRELADAGVAVPGDCPQPSEILTAADDPAGIVGRLGDPALWMGALEALAIHPDAREQLARLVRQAPAGHLDAVAERLIEAGGADDLTEIVRAALTAPNDNLEICLWLYTGPAVELPDAPSPAEMLSRLLGILEESQRDWDTERARLKEIHRDIRSAFSAQGYRAFREAVARTDEAVAPTLKRRIERVEGLAQAVRDQMLDILREAFPRLFVSARAEPWDDESVLWTTEEALRKYQAELKELLEKKIPENSRAIGAAAAHGDLSENSEWKFAVEEQGMLKARAAKMQDEIARARVIHPDDAPTEHVGIGSRVRLEPVGGGAEVTVDFLGVWDGDVQNRVFSYKTKLAQEMMGKRIGDTVELQLEGATGTYRIAGLGSAVEQQW